VTRPSLPTDEAIAARAVELKLVDPGAVVPPRVRQQVAAILHKENTPDPQAPAPELRSRQEFPVDGGVLRVDVVFIPRKDPT
jgi:hypothetical protein